MSDYTTSDPAYSPRAGMAQGMIGSGGIHTFDPAEVARMKAEREEAEAHWREEQARERDERNRNTALQLAVAVRGQNGNPADVIDTAGSFLDFLTGAQKRAH